MAHGDNVINTVNVSGTAYEICDKEALETAGTGLTKTDKTVDLKPATSTEIGGVKVNFNNGVLTISVN